MRNHPSEAGHTQAVLARGIPSPLLHRGGGRVDIETIINLFSNYAFPVVCVVVLFVMWYRETEKHEAEMDKMTEALNNNTLAMQKLVDKLGGA